MQNHSSVFKCVPLHATKSQPISSPKQEYEYGLLTAYSTTQSNLLLLNLI